MDMERALLDVTSSMLTDSDTERTLMLSFLLGFTLIVLILCAAMRRRSLTPSTIATPKRELALSIMRLDELSESIARINTHLLDEQIIEAGELLMRVQSTIQQFPAAKEAIAAKTSLLTPFLGRISTAELLRRHSECTQAVRDLAVGEGWRSVLETPTSTTSVRKLADGTSWIQSSSRVRVGLTELLATWKEGDLFVHWLPDCVDSRVLRQITPVESLVWWRTRTAAGIDMDASMHCYPCDAFKRHGFALMIGRPATPEDWPDVSWPPLARWGLRAPALAMSIKLEQVGRPPFILPLRSFPHRTHPLGDTWQVGRHVHSCFVIGPVAAALLRVPKFIIGWVLKNSLSLILEGQARCALEARDHPKGHPLAERIAQRSDFYREWLLPRLPKSADAPTGEVDRRGAGSTQVGRPQAVVDEGKHEVWHACLRCMGLPIHGGAAPSNACASPLPRLVSPHTLVGAVGVEYKALVSYVTSNCACLLHTRTRSHTSHPYPLPSHSHCVQRTSPSRCCCAPSRRRPYTRTALGPLCR